MNNSLKSLSIVIPVFNETKRLSSLDEIFELTKKGEFKFEIIVVNDGSTDQTLPLLKKCQDKYPLKVISYTPNRGKGYALKQGVLQAQGQYVLFMDIDLSTPLSELSKFKKYLDKYDVLIGTRKIGSSVLIKRQPWLRETLGKGFTALSNLFLGLHISDFTCGFKMFKAEAAKQIFSHLTIDRWGFDSEVLYLAYKYNYTIKEVPVSWVNDPNTKVKFPQDLIYSLQELLTIRLNNIFGKY